MKNTILKSLSLAGISLMMALSVAAQEEPKVKVSDKETKYKSEDVKIKDKKEESKYKSDDYKVKDDGKEYKSKSANVKMKDKKEESKYKSEDLKIKDEKDERKMKAKVTPMQRTKSVRTELKTGETNVRVQEHVDPIDVAPVAPEPAVAEIVPVPEAPKVAPKPVKKYVAKKPVARKPVVAAKPSTGPKPKYIVKTKVVRDTVFVPSPPEKVVTVEKEYVHDTVTVTRVDTVVTVETKNTYTGYSVPRGEFKKVKLKTDKDNGEVYMKRKEKDGKIKTEKIR